MTAGPLSRETVRARSRMILLSRSTSFAAANNWPISPQLVMAVVASRSNTRPSNWLL